MRDYTLNLCHRKKLSNYPEKELLLSFIYLSLSPCSGLPNPITVAPDANFFSLSDQFVAKIGVSYADQAFGPFPKITPTQVDHAIFSTNILDA
jgi:hypothetical protein